ncbi:MAG: tripartite tricarboxylate transporter substrate binding protein [Sulfolobales archaeon]
MGECVSKTTLYLLIIVAVLVIGVGAYVVLRPGGGAEAYPTKPITIYVPWSAGGGTDLTTRQIAAYLQSKFGVQVNVLNRVAGGGAATMYVGAKEAPDGYTLTAVIIELNMFPHTGALNITYKDYELIAMLICNPASVAVRADAPWKTLKDLLTYIKEHPGELKASGTATGGVWDIARVGLLKAAGIDVNALPWVPSAGFAPALQELLAGGIQVAIGGSGEVKPYKDAGQIRVLAVMNDKRVEGLEDVPTLVELGYNFSICGWAGLAAPKGTPPEIINKLANAVKEGYYSEQFQKFLKERGFVGRLLLTKEFEQYCAREYELMRDLLKTAGYAK